MILPMPTDAGASHGLAEQGVGALAALRWDEVVRRLEVAGIDLVLLHEIEDVDRARPFERGALEVLIGEHDILSLGVLVSFDDLAPGNRLAVFGAYTLVLDGREVFGMEHSERDAISSDGGAQLDGNADESEADRSFPDRRHSVLSVLRFHRIETWKWARAGPAVEKNICDPGAGMRDGKRPGRVRPGLFVAGVRS